MTFKAAGAPCDLYREHILLNSGSFSTTANTDSDVYRETAITMGMPARLTHTIDATAYTAGAEEEDSWIAALRFGWSPANLGGGGDIGNLT
jgi:hypothetical protein